MEIESIEALIDWAKSLHQALHEALEAGAAQQTSERPKELMAYLAEKESRLAQIIGGFEERADAKALRTRVYDWAPPEHLNREAIIEKSYGTMSYDAVAEDVIAIHNEILELFEYLIGRSSIPEEAALLEALKEAEENETMQLAQQMNRGWEM